MTDALYQNQFSSLTVIDLTQQTEEKGLWEREAPSRQRAGRQQVSTASPVPVLRGTAEKCSWEGLWGQPMAVGLEWQERGGHEATGQTRPTPQSITFTKRFGGVGTTFILKQT